MKKSDVLPLTEDGRKKMSTAVEFHRETHVKLLKHWPTGAHGMQTPEDN